MKRLTVTPGFWLLAAGVWVLEPAILWPTALAALCHELGHCGAMWLLGNGPGRLRLSALGAELSPKRPLSYAAELPVALAGPVVSVACALLAARWRAYLFAGLSLALGVFNLLPIGALDGGRVMACLCALTLPPPFDRKAPEWTAVAAAGLLLGAAVAAFVRFAGVSLLVVAVWLCYRSVRDLLEL